MGVLRAGDPAGRIAVLFPPPGLTEDAAAELVISASCTALVAAQVTITARATLGSFTAGAWRRAGHGAAGGTEGALPARRLRQSAQQCGRALGWVDDHVRGLQQFRGRLITADRDRCGADLPGGQLAEGAKAARSPRS